MAKFPADAPKRKAIRALEASGFCLIREREHVACLREDFFRCGSFRAAIFVAWRGLGRIEGGLVVRFAADMSGLNR